MGAGLRWKIRFFLIFTFLGISVFLYFVLRLTLIPKFVELEGRQAERDIDLASNALENEMEELSSIAGDWTPWDDTYKFVEDRNQKYIDDNLQDETLKNLKVNLMIFVDRSGHVVHGKSFDLAKSKETAMPKRFRSDIPVEDRLIHHTNLEDRVKGVVILPEGILLAASRPILTSDGQGPIHGAGIFGRFVNEMLIRKIIDRVHLNLSVHLVQSGQIPPDLAEVRSQLLDEKKTVVRPLDSNLIAGYAVINDIYGKPALFLRLEKDRTIYQYGLTASHYLMIFMGVGVLLLGGLFSLFVERGLLGRLAKLTQDVFTIGSKKDLGARVFAEGPDELAHLGKSINEMLGQVEQAERDLIEKTEALKKTNEDLQRFTYVASHDLLEPLKKLESLCGLLGPYMNNQPTEGGRDLLRGMQETLSDVMKVVETILRYSRLTSQAKVVSTVDLKAVARGVVSRLGELISQSNGKIEIGDLPSVKADPNQMQLLLENLISNSFKFGRPGETTRVRVLGERLPDGSVQIRIEDNGMGFEKKQGQKIFEPFQRFSSSEGREGMGIGLAICRRIMESHNGKITADGTPGRGSVFTLTFPKDLLR